MKNAVNSFGLTEKSQVNTSGDEKTLNFKIKVDPKFYERWNSTLQKLSTKYNGGGTTIILNTIETLLPQLEALAENIPAIATTNKVEA